DAPKKVLDETGLQLVCTHMGCKPKWNPAEESWDCPCHGSRFSKDGKISEDPL
ncbi:Rieske 2Fe-2S domain-containing protein, partial [Candidatus Bathyarchaeota archaeon]|nr:Rieske 2Fe-2S domain-containing protein [Candidatus Bathyarchaeota archaeon]